MVQQKQIKDKNEFFEFDTMRQCAQCLGRVMRKKTDYGMMILADTRFNKPGKYNKLPNWIKKSLETSMIDITMETASVYAANFFREMGRTFILEEKLFKREEHYKEGVVEQEAKDRQNMKEETAK